MTTNTKKIIVIISATFIGALATWAIINWIPSTTILFGSAACGVIAWRLTKNIK